MSICLQDFAAYLAFCGIVLHNAQLYETSLLENRRNQVRPWVRPRDTDLRRVCESSVPPLPLSDVVVIPWLLLIPVIAVSLMKLSGAALGKDWVHSSLGCEEWFV